MLTALLGVALGVSGLLASAPSVASENPALPYRVPVPMIAADAAKSSNSFAIDFLDVGQGDAILVSANGQRLLVDGGPSRDRLRDRVQSLGVTDIDAILVTNPDADHIRGLIEAFALFQVETFYASASTNPSATYSELLAAAASEPGIKIVTLSRGATVPLGGLQLNVLHPQTISGDRNDDSIAMRLSCGKVAVLLMGDATTTSEAEMIKAGLIGKVDVVKAGHHGSRTSSGDAFVNAAKPSYVVFSAGRDNSYGHPHPEVVARYQAAGAQAIYTDTTAADDTVVMSSDCLTVTFSKPTPGSPPVTPIPTGPAPPGTPPPAPSATVIPGGVCGGATATIVGVDKVGEVVTLSASGNLTGWRLVSLTGSQSFDFPSGFVATGTVQVRSAVPIFANTATTLWWSTSNVWNNSSNDDAALYNCVGQLVQTFDDGE
ncbi:MAG: MBL fold metallo-hydrolase [bacterium]